MSSAKKTRTRAPTGRGSAPVGLPSLLASPGHPQLLPSARELGRVLSEVEREEPTSMNPVEFDDGTQNFPAVEGPRRSSVVVPDARVAKYTVPEPERLPENDEPTQPCARPAALRPPANDIALNEAWSLRIAASAYRLLNALTLRLRRYLARRGAL